MMASGSGIAARVGIAQIAMSVIVSTMTVCVQRVIVGRDEIAVTALPRELLVAVIGLAYGAVEGTVEQSALEVPMYAKQISVTCETYQRLELMCW